MDRKQYTQAVEANYLRGLEKIKTEPEPSGQKFPCGSLVMIAKDLGSMMSHFKSGCRAKVDHVYAHAYGGTNINSYSLLVEQDDGSWSSSAWYKEHQLSLIEAAND